jgi:hypothetical protein
MDSSTQQSFAPAFSPNDVESVEQCYVLPPVLVLLKLVGVHGRSSFSFPCTLAAASSEDALVLVHAPVHSLARASLKRSLLWPRCVELLDRAVVSIRLLPCWLRLSSSTTPLRRCLWRSSTYHLLRQCRGRRKRRLRLKKGTRAATRKWKKRLVTAALPP